MVLKDKLESEVKASKDSLLKIQEDLQTKEKSLKELT